MFKNSRTRTKSIPLIFLFLNHWYNSSFLSQTYDIVLNIPSNVQILFGIKDIPQSWISSIHETILRVKRERTTFQRTEIFHNFNFQLLNLLRFCVRFMKTLLKFPPNRRPSSNSQSESSDEVSHKRSRTEEKWIQLIQFCN